MPLPRKGILIRLAIYVPLILFFGWQALEKYLDRRETSEAADETRKKLDSLPPEKFQTYTLPDGTVTKVPVLTPEEAEDIYGVEVEAPPPEPEPAPAEVEARPAPAPVRTGPGITASGPPRD